MVALFLGHQGMAVVGLQQPAGRLQRLGQLLQRLGPRAQKSGRALLPWLDPLTALALGIFHLLICLQFAPYGFNDFGADGVQFKTALDIAEGGVIFRDTWSQYGVLTHHLHALTLLLLGKTLLSLKYYTCAVYMLLSYVQYFVLRRFLPRPLALLTALCWIGVAPHYEHAIIAWPHVDALLFQLLSLLCLFRFVDRDQVRYLVLAGVMTGLSWAAKQSVGAFHFLALLGFVPLAYLLPDSRISDLLRLAFWWKAARIVWTKVVPLLLGFALVLGLILVVLAYLGAYQDWRKQTLVFPRSYYLDFYLSHMPTSGPIMEWLGKPEEYGLVRQALALLLTWYRDSVNTTFGPACGRHWILLWLSAILVGYRSLGRADADSRLGVLLALVAGTSWISTIPSMHTMHQWWTLTPVFGMLTYFLWTYLKDSPWMVRWLGTVAVLSFLFAYPIGCNLSNQVHAARTETISQVPALEGMLTTPEQAETVQTIYQAITQYRERYPSAKLTTVDDDSLTLLFLPCIEQNRNFHPIYWSCPVLADKVYPHHPAATAAYLRDQQPLVVACLHVKQLPDLAQAGYRRVFEVKEKSGVFGFCLYAPESATVPAEWAQGPNAPRVALQPR